MTLIDLIKILFNCPKNNNQLNKCIEEKNTLSDRLADVTEEVNSLSKRLTTTNNDFLALQEMNKIFKDNNILLKNNLIQAQKDFSKLEKINDALKTENDRLNINLEKVTSEIEKLIPDYYTFAEFIKKYGKEIAEPLQGYYKALLWWELEKVLWIIFAKPSIKPYQEISSDELKAKVDAIYNGSSDKFPQLKWPESGFSDGKYRITTIANIKEIFLKSYVGLIPYIAEFHDCSDFAREFFVHLTRYTLNSTLCVWGNSDWGYHAYNLIVCSDGVVMLEPQLSGWRTGKPEDYFKVLPEVIGVNWIPQIVRDV